MKPGTTQEESVVYEIRVRGVLDERWSDWLGGMTVVPQPCGETLLIGSVRDQAALHGLIVKIRDMGLPLLSVNPIEVDSPGKETE